MLSASELVSPSPARCSCPVANRLPAIFCHRNAEGGRKPCNDLSVPSFSAGTLEPGKSEQAVREDQRTERVSGVNMVGARLKPREEGGKASGRSKPVKSCDRDEQGAK
jgi:hypothetical protein